jgi:serine/threonine protein phosphatase 1
MFNLFRKRPSAIVQPVLRDTRIYAVGDVHGRADQLVRLLDMIRDDCERGPRPAHVEVILLGDYIDRGRESAAVLDMLDGLNLPGIQLTLLRGNHEQVLLDLAAQPRTKTLSQWLTYGGLETLASYGLPSRLLYSNDVDAILAAMAQAIPDTHLALLETMPLHRRVGDYFFVHAGVRPKRALEAQDAHDLIWIREPFLSSADDFGAVIVHGHSISRAVESRPNRIGVDTGAYATGILTAVVLEEDQRRFLATKPI